MKKKGFTLVELLVVIAIIALLMGILMPALARVRALAARIVCGANLSGLGKSLMLYANDFDESYPTVGSGVWDTDGQINDYMASEGPYTAYGNGTTYSGSKVTVTAALYTLIKYADASPAQFICKGDQGAKEFKMPAEATNEGLDMAALYDFGPDSAITNDMPGTHNSYAYHLPYTINATGQSAFPLTVTGSPQSPVMADRNPWNDKNCKMRLQASTTEYKAVEWKDPPGEYYDEDKKENAGAHGYEGQNVLFLDSHVDFAKYPNVGIENDNIYKAWPDTWTGSSPEAGIKQGAKSGFVTLNHNDAATAGARPKAYGDAFLVSERNE